MTTQSKKSVVLIGGGHTHALVLNSLKLDALEGSHVTVINPDGKAAYSGMLPGFVAGHYRQDELYIDIQALCHKVGATLVVGKAISMDLERKLVHIDDGTQISYDLVSVDVGISSRMKSLPGFATHGVPAKPLSEFSVKWGTYRSTNGPKHVVVIGGGIAGAELAMAMAFALKTSADEVSVKLLDRGKVLASNSVSTQTCVLKELKKNNVAVMEGVEVVEVNASNVMLSDGSSLNANFVVGAAGATPHPWLNDTGLSLHEGFVIVDDSLMTSQAGVFAVGDCAHMIFDPRPKAGVYAVRQAPILLKNIKQSLAGDSLICYAPQSDYLKLISLGDKRAFGERRGWRFSGNLVWQLKNYIDRSFMRQF